MAPEAGDSTGEASRARAELLEPPRKLLQACIDALHRALGEMLDPFGKDALCFAGEALDGKIELATEPLRGFLPRGAKGAFELLRGRLGMARCFS